MITLREISGYLEGLAPLSLQESYDNSGVQVGDPGMEVSGILVTLDVSEGVLLEAEKLGFNLVLSHHPVIFGGLKSITGRTAPERIVKMAIEGYRHIQWPYQFRCHYGRCKQCTGGKAGPGGPEDTGSAERKPEESGGLCSPCPA